MKNNIFKIKIYSILKYVLGVVLLPFFFVNRSDTPDSVVCSWAVILIALCLCLYRDFKQTAFTVTKRIFWISIPVTILFLIMLSLDEIINSPFFSSAYLKDYTDFSRFGFLFWTYVLYLPVLCISAWILVYAFFDKCLGAHDDKSSHTKKPNIIIDETQGKKLFWLCFSVLSAFSLVALFSAYPGIWIEGDVATVLHYVENEWSNWHPFPYLLLVWLGKTVFKTTFSINVFQTIVWLLLQIYILSVLKSIRLRCMLIYTVILCIASTPFTYLAVMYKDTLFSMGVLGITAALFQIIRKRHMSKVDFAVLNGAGLLVTLFRHAGQAVTIVMCACCILFFWKNRKLLFRFAATLVIQIGIFLFFGVILFQQFQVTENPDYVKYSTPMAMIGAAAESGMEFEAEDIAQLEKIMSLEDWGNCYNKYWADSISRWWGDIGTRINTVETLIHEEDYGSFLIKMNAKILIKDPKLYLRALFDMNSILWEFGMPADYDDMSLCQVNENESIRYTAFHRLTDTWWKFEEELPVTHSLFQRAGFSLFLILVTLFVFFKKKKRDYLLSCIPVIVHNILLAITIPAQDPRYALPAIECAIFIAALLPALRKLTETQDEELLVADLPPAPKNPH